MSGIVPQNNGLQIFSYENHEVRTVFINGEPWWVSSDVCDVLGIDRTQIRRLDDDEKGVHRVLTKGGMQSLSVISMNGAKRLIISSRSNKAIDLAKSLGIEILNNKLCYKEAEAIRVLIAAFKHLEPLPQHSIGPYRIDLYFPSHLLAVECDEQAHKDRPPAYEKQRQAYIQASLGCKFYRFNPDVPNFNIGDVVNDLIQILVYEE